jgi:hypothetical protein
MWNVLTRRFDAGDDEPISASEEMALEARKGTSQLFILIAVCCLAGEDA